MNRGIRAPFVTTVASVVFAGAALSGSACGPNPPEPADCPLDTPSSGATCYGHSTCYYDTPGCEGVSSTWTTAACAAGKWQVAEGGSSCNPPMPFDSGTIDVSTDADSAACPKDEPAIGAACDGTALCSYQNLCPQTSGFKTNTYRCASGKWSFDNTLESPIDCPKTEPRDGEACGCAMYLPSKCSYAGTCGSDEAICDGATQKWIVKAATCSDGGTDAPASDAAESDSAPTETSTDAGTD
jgi:hypothetical protein